MTKTTDNTQSILEAVTEKPGSTAAELAEATGLGRSTVNKLLATLERDRQVTRTPGERDGRRRTADQWSKATTERLRPASSTISSWLTCTAHRARRTG